MELAAADAPQPGHRPQSRPPRRGLDIESVEADWRDDSFTVQPERVLEVAEIAASMDAGLPSTKQRLRRGRMMLVSALAEDDARRRASLAQPMRCWRARRHASAYLDGELDPGTVAAVEDHLAGCPTCPPLDAALVGVRARLEGLRDPDTVVEEAMARRVRAHVTAQVHGGLGHAARHIDHDHAAR